jgi:hypothetical protein
MKVFNGNETESSPTAYVNRVLGKNEHNIPTTILSEYSMKRDIFDPRKNSPNLFLNKLEKRMNIYYTSMYNSIKQ